MPSMRHIYEARAAASVHLPEVYEQLVGASYLNGQARVDALTAARDAALEVVNEIEAALTVETTPLRAAS